MAIGSAFFLLALAQTVTSTGAIQGTVSDTSGALVAEARVAAQNVNSGLTRLARSGPVGEFHLGSLPAGSYLLRVEKDGFTTLEVAAFPVSVGQIVVQRLTLQLAGVAGRVDVTETVDAVETAATGSSVALGDERIEEAPARTRNFLNFVHLAPGLVPSAGAGPARYMTGVRNPLADSGFSFAGLRGRNNSMNIDGVDNRDETTGGNRVAIGLEMIHEFRVATVAVGAELGGAAGGLVNVVTRSGVNLWHGDFTFFAQSGRLNAKRSEAPPAERPAFRRFQPGVSAGGPVRKDRTFFFTALEHENESGQEWSETPADAASLVNRALRLPVYSGVPVRSIRTGFFDTAERGSDFTGKLSHQAGARDTLEVRYAFSRGHVLGDAQGADNPQDESTAGGSLTTDHSLVGNWMSVLTPGFVHEIRFQFGERRQRFWPNSDGPMFEIPGVVSFGQSWRLNASRRERHYEAVESINFVAGRHRLSTGAAIHAVTLNARLANRFGGIYIFPTAGDFERGLPDVFLQAFGDPRTSMVTLPVGLWLQDRWQIRQDLVLEAGFRYDRQRMPAGLPSSTNNLSPRLGLAWRPWDSTPWVFRAGFGLFYDRYPLAFLNDALQKDGIHGYEQYAAGPEAARALAVSRGATLKEPLPDIPRSSYLASPELPSTYSRKFSAGLERGFGKDTTFTIEATHVRGFHLPRVRNTAGRLPPSYQLEQTARSDYRGLTVALNRRMSRELAYLFSYTAGRARDDGSDFDEHPLDPGDIRKDWARSRNHQLHRLALSFLFELPIEELASAPGWLREPLERISLAPVLTLASGRPINALLTTDAFRTGAYPISARPPGMPRNPFYSPGAFSVDLRLMKTIPVKNERARLQFGVESFNLTNHFNPDKISQFYAAGQTVLASYGRSIEAGAARQVQMFVQFEY